MLRRHVSGGKRHKGASTICALWLAWPRRNGLGNHHHHHLYKGACDVVLTRVVDDLESLERFASGWDALAVACRRPRSTPAFTVAWYRHALPPGARIRAVLVTDGDDVVGTAPFYVVRTKFGLCRYELAAPVLFGVEPLFAPGREEEVAAAIGLALARPNPCPTSCPSTRCPWGRCCHGSCVEAGPVPGRLSPRDIRFLSRTFFLVTEDSTHGSKADPRRSKRIPVPTTASSSPKVLSTGPRSTPKTSSSACRISVVSMRAAELAEVERGPRRRPLHGRRRRRRPKSSRVRDDSGSPPSSGPER